MQTRNIVAAEQLRTDIKNEDHGLVGELHKQSNIRKQKDITFMYSETHAKHIRDEEKTRSHIMNNIKPCTCQ